MFSLVEVPFLSGWIAVSWSYTLSLQRSHSLKKGDRFLNRGLALQPNIQRISSSIPLIPTIPNPNSIRFPLFQDLI
ncbi:MAG: hypothetical protein V7K50_27215 [Nostoc sp.]|uniref:hypothetical protein n=1 Tax=Nostoc sp. TaxID=1180 RepID=UPI002FF5390F